MRAFRRTSQKPEGLCLRFGIGGYQYERGPSEVLLCRTMYGEFSLAEKCDNDNCRYSTEKEKNLVCGKGKGVCFERTKGIVHEIHLLCCCYPASAHRSQDRRSFRCTALAALDCYATGRHEAEQRVAGPRFSCRRRSVHGTTAMAAGDKSWEDCDLQRSPTIQQCFLLRLSGAIQIICRSWATCTASALLTPDFSGFMTESLLPCASGFPVPASTDPEVLYFESYGTRVMHA